MQERLLLQHLMDRRAGRSQMSPLPGTTTFLSPSVIPCGHFRDDGIWVPPSASIASRMPPARSKGFCRGFAVDQQSNRAVVFESALERDFACILMADRRVILVHDQPPAVPYRTPDGKPHHHTFDFLVHTADGRRLAFAVKPASRVERSGIKTTLALVEDQAGERFADAFLLRTERHITKERAFNANTILQARRGRNEADVRAVTAIAMTLKGDVRLRDLVEHADLGGRGWNAAVCLIDEGILELAQRGRVTYDAMVRLKGGAHG